jgi:hypothetical protein
MVTCENCHKQITRTNPKYCHRCGYSFFRAVASAVAPPTPSPAIPSPSAAKEIEEILAVLPLDGQEEVLRKFEPILQQAEARLGLNPGNPQPDPNSLPPAPSPARMDLDADDGPSVNLLDVVDESEATGDKRTANDDWTAESAARWRSTRRANRRGIVMGLALGIAPLALLHLTHARFGLLPFVRFGNLHRIAITRPVTLHDWCWEIAGLLLMLCSAAVANTRFNVIRGFLCGNHAFFRGFILSLVAMLIYTLAAVCIGIGS